MVGILLLILLLTLGALVLTGHTADTRDPEFGLGRVIAPHSASHDSTG